MPEGRLSSKLICDNSAGSLTWVNDCYAHIFYKEGQELTIDDFSEFMVAASEFLDYKPPLIVERRYSYSVAADVYPFMNELLPRFVSAIAYVSYTPAAKRLSVLSGEILAPSIPSRVFPSMELAVQWIQEKYIGGPKVPFDTN